jgi:signal transduction histidine kinase/CheY-like chemotaxis protein
MAPADVAGPLSPAADALLERAAALDRPLTLTPPELDADPDLGPLARAAGASLHLRGWLSVPLRGRDGRPMGLLQVTDKLTGGFTEEDTSLLGQLADIAAVAIENAAYREALEANRLKDEFLAILSHELRAPLHPILMWVRMLRERALDPDTTARALDTIERNTKAQAQIISDLLDVSRIVSGKLHLQRHPVDLRTVIEAALESLRPAARAKAIQLTATLEPLTAAVSGDPDRLQQVVWNLVSNAIKFTPAGGSVRVGLRGVGAHAEIGVADTGRGIGPDFLPFVFERFRQADPSTTREHGGLGLGLAIVKHLVEGHGGSVSVESAGPGQGATFTVRLPAGAGLAPEPPAPPQPAAVSLDGLHVLLVDDEADTRAAVAAALEGYGARVTAAASARQALAAFLEARPDAIVSDIAMPGEDGYGLIREVRAREHDGRAGVPAIALTAHARAEDREHAIAAGFQAHVPKPVEAAELARLLASLAARRLSAAPAA